MRGVEDQIHLGSRRKAPRLVQARRIRRKKRNGMHIPLSPHSIPKLKEAGREPASGETRLGNRPPPPPCPHLKRKRENGTGREICISDPSAFTLAMLVEGLALGKWGQMARSWEAAIPLLRAQPQSP